MSREGKGISMPQRKACGLQWALPGKCRAVTWAAGRLGEQHMGTPHGNASQRSSQWITKFKPWGLIGGGNRFGFRKKKWELGKNKGKRAVWPRSVSWKQNGKGSNVKSGGSSGKSKFPGKELCYFEHFRSEGHSWVHLKFQGMLRYPNPAQDVRRHF